MSFKAMFRCWTKPASGWASTCTTQQSRHPKTPAFYGILLGHQNRQTIVEIEVCGAKRVVIGKRMRIDLDTMPGQQLKKALRIADARNRMCRATGETRESRLFALPASGAH